MEQSQRYGVKKTHNVVYGMLTFPVKSVCVCVTRAQNVSKGYKLRDWDRGSGGLINQPSEDKKPYL